MTVLDGEKVEALLWDAGYDFEHKIGIEGFTSLEVYMGDTTIVVSETWLEEGDWFVDSNTLILEKIYEGVYTDSDFDIIESEEELVQHIVDLGKN